MRHAAELELLDLIESCPTCRDRHVHSFLGDKFGVVVTWEGAPVGMWGWIDGALRFRTLANWEPRIVANDAGAALAATIKIAEARDWFS